jgi:predicted DCC family thiol-disulfide oxidoreductase YuxK
MGLVMARDLLLYDGVCGLCDRTVQFLLARDARGHLAFAPLQGPTAAAARVRLGFPSELSTVVLVTNPGTPNERAYLRSDAVLRALEGLGGTWRLAAVLRVVPRALRDPLYELVARHRYRWFGRLGSCRLPSPEQAERFLP